MIPIRVSIPLAGFNLSGGVKSLCGVANALAARGHQVRILVPDYAAQPPIPLNSAVQVRLLRAGPRRLPAPARKLVHLAHLATTATAGADVCLANYFTTAYAAVCSKLLRGDRCALAYNVRGYEPVSHGLQAAASLPSRLVRSALAWGSYRLPLQKIVTTEWLRERTGDSAAYVVGHGIDLDAFRPPPERADVSQTGEHSSGRHEQPAPGAEAACLTRTAASVGTSAPESEPAATGIVIGTIARESVVKGYPDFLNALALLPPDLPIRLRLARPDPVPIPDRFPVDVCRPTTESAMARFYGDCDVFVFSSRAEGFGLPALEAMACGLAVVTTDCGGVNAFARPGVNCLMVPPEDPRALADAVARVVRDAALRTRLGAAGILTARGFGRDAVLARFCTFLERLTLSRTDRPTARAAGPTGAGARRG